MIERYFADRRQPLLREAVQLLRERYASGACWDMSRVLVALPGAQAGRRLRRLLRDEAHDAGIAVFAEPGYMTPARLLEELYPVTLPTASRMQTHFAWIQAAASVSADERQALTPKADGTNDPMVWAGIAGQAQRARATAAAERLTLCKIAALCAKIPDVCDDKRWQALSHLEGVYLRILAETGLADQDQARMQAVDQDSVSCGKDIYLIGTQDLNGLERAMLSALNSTVVAVIPAPNEEQQKFDETGCLRVSEWLETLHSIPESLIRFVDGPADETNALVEQIAALGGAFAPEEITLGIGDEAAAESMGQRLAALGLPSFSPFGRPLSRVRPAALLNVVRDYLNSPGTRTFAALARHPDLEAWLAARNPPAKETEADISGAKLPLLTSLDVYRAECFAAELPTGGADDPDVKLVARANITAARESTRVLLTGLSGRGKPISAWAEPIADFLREVYRETLIGEDAEGRQFARGLLGLQEILQGMKDLPPALSPAVTGEEALAFVLGQAESSRLPSEPSGMGLETTGAGLEMMGWLELALDDAPVLLLTGLQEGCVPAGTGDDSLLPDSLRRALGLADDRRQEARDGFLLRQMVETRQAEGCLVRLIVPRRGADGAPRLPSRLLFACGAEEAARRVARFVDRPKDAPACLPLFFAGKTRRLQPSLPLPYDIPLTEMSVSCFADYLACPYRFYLRHIVKLAEQDDSEDEMNPGRFGDLLHDCLKAFAKSSAARNSDAGAVQKYFQEQLETQSRKHFGANPARALQLQVRQAGRRLGAFAEWQAETVRDGWAIQAELSEVPLTAALVVDGQGFEITGRLDRIDYHARSDRFRIIDYKTGDAGKGPEEKHRSKDKVTGEVRWTDLQLPLYRILLAASGVDAARSTSAELGYVLLSSDLAPITYSERNKRSGGTGFVAASWEEADHESALICAEEVIRNVRAGTFWPPADPSPSPPSRIDPGRADVYSGLCFDTSSDRRDWLGFQ